VRGQLTCEQQVGDAPPDVDLQDEDDLQQGEDNSNERRVYVDVSPPGLEEELLVHYHSYPKQQVGRDSDEAQLEVGEVKPLDQKVGPRAVGDLHQVIAKGREGALEDKIRYD
jgi:hypothetical protein